MNSRWFQSVSTAGAPALHLFCFPYAGGNAHVFRDWQKELPEIDVCMVHLPGRAMRIAERPRTQLLPLVQEIADVFPTEINGQFAFFGYSMGALIAFELARELRRRGMELPVHLFLSACRAPSRVSAMPPTYNLPLPELMDELRKLNGTPKEFFEYPEIRDALLPLLRADFEITDTYEYLSELPLSCPITIYGGDQDDIVKMNDLAPWELQTSAEFTTRIFSGDHFFIQNPQVKFVETFRQDLQRVFPARIKNSQMSFSRDHG